MLTPIDTVDDEYATVETYACDFVVITAGDGLWGCEKGRAVRVTEISVSRHKDDAGEYEDYKTISVKHDSNWRIYTDTAFENAVSAALGYRVVFTEQGMQENELASMET